MFSNRKIRIYSFELEKQKKKKKLLYKFIIMLYKLCNFSRVWVIAFRLKTAGHSYFQVFINFVYNFSLLIFLTSFSKKITAMNIFIRDTMK